MKEIGEKLKPSYDELATLLMGKATVGGAVALEPETVSKPYEGRRTNFGYVVPNQPPQGAGLPENDLDDDIDPITGKRKWKKSH